MYDNSTLLSTGAAPGVGHEDPPAVFLNNFILLKTKLQ